MKRMLWFAVLVSSLSAAVGEVAWKPKCNMDNNLFPSLILATATVRPDTEDDEPNPDLLGDAYGLLGVSLKAPAAGAKVKVTVRENSLMAASSWSGELPKAGETYFVAPKVNYKFDQLRRARQQVPLNVTFAVEVNGKPEGEQTETITVRSINDCPWAVLETEETIDDDPANEAKSAQKKEAQKKESAEDDDDEEEESESTESSADADTSGDEWEDLGWMGAAYVNEGSPVVDEILKEAIDDGWTNSFAGYQRGPEDVLREVLAVWSALQNRGIHYSSITATPSRSERVHSQHIRFVDESLANQQANCADGSVMFCSILRKLGLRTFVVYVPGHMYMGVYLKRTGDERIAIETTMLGIEDADPKIIDELKALYATFDSDNKQESTWKTFAAAVAVGTGDLKKNKAKFDDENEAAYQIIEIDEARADGIMPISSDK
jgi:hypothetical protein